MIYQTRSEMLAALGTSLRSARLAANVTLQALADQCGISLHALRNLELGKNASTASLVEVCRALKCTDWILNLAPAEVDDSLFDRKEPKKRLRASAKRSRA